jgi:site-specific recombinase XerD
MAAARSFADMLAQFLTIYLPVTRACSPNTVSAYRDAFTLFLRFMDQQQTTTPDKVSFADFTAPNVAAFLGWLRTDRQCSAATANQRLAALKSFFRYVQAQAPEQIAQARQVLGVKAAQVPQPTIGYLPVEGIGLLLEHATRRGPGDLALLTTLYDTAARAQEICDLSIGNLHLGKPASATLTGKGRKTRRSVRAGVRQQDRPTAGTSRSRLHTRQMRPRRAHRPPRPGAREDLPPRAAPFESDAPAGKRSQPDLHPRPPRARIHRHH